MVLGTKVPCKKVKKKSLKEKPSSRLIFSKISSASDPPSIDKSIYFRASMLIWIGIRD